MANLGDNHKRHVTSILRHVDDMLAGSAADLGLPEERLFHASPVRDATPEQLKVISDNLALFRGASDCFLDRQGIERNKGSDSALWQFRVVLEAIKNELEDMTPKRLAGYGALNADATAEIEGLLHELYRILNQTADHLKTEGEPTHWDDGSRPREP